MRDVPAQSWRETTLDEIVADRDTMTRARQARAEFSRFMLHYRFAVDELLTKINILKAEFEHLHDYSPIEHVTSRVKSLESILDKARRRGIPLQRSALREQMTDIAGVRVVCSFISDVYWFAEMLTGQDDIAVLEVKDYIAEPKDNGYRSLHVIVQVPVFLSESIEQMRVELQIRTAAMDFWAGLEHKIRYKYDGQIPDELVAELTQAAQTAAELDAKMEAVHDVTRRLNEQAGGRDAELSALPLEVFTEFLDG